MQSAGDNDRNGGSSRRNQSRRYASQSDAKPIKLSRVDIIRFRSALMERAVYIEDLKHLKFAGRSLYDVFTERGWTGILEIKGKVYSNIVYDFYAPQEESSGMSNTLSAWVRGTRVVITPENIASFLNLPQPQYLKYRSSSQQPVDILQALTGNEHAGHDNENISPKDLLPFFQMLHLIIAANIQPTKHTTDMISIKQGSFLLDIASGVNIDLPYHIFKTIEKAGCSDSSKDGLPFGVLITGLSLKAGVKLKTGEKEDEPMAGLIRMIKPSEIGQLACPSTQEDVGTLASSSQTLPLWFDAMLLEVRSQIAAEVAPIQRQLTDINSRLKTVEDRVHELNSQNMQE